MDIGIIIEKGREKGLAFIAISLRKRRVFVNSETHLPRQSATGLPRQNAAGLLRWWPGDIHRF